MSDEPLCYVNGRIQPTRAATIGINDLGLLRGYGVFDFGRVYHGRLFHFERNIGRFRRSAAALSLDVPLSDGELLSITKQLIGDNPAPNTGIRLLLTGGYSTYLPQYEDPNVLIIPQLIPPKPAATYTNGIKLMTVEYQRELPHVKSTNYVNAIRLEPLKRQRGVDDMLYHAAHGVTECPRSNFFLIKDGVLITPNQHILEGITRSVILELAPQANLKVETRPVPLDELRTAEEAFITSSTQGVVPVTEIDGEAVGKNGRVGPHTKTITDLFKAYTASFS